MSGARGWRVWHAFSASGGNGSGRAGGVPPCWGGWGARRSTIRTALPRVGTTGRVALDLQMALPCVGWSGAGWGLTLVRSESLGFGDAGREALEREARALERGAPGCANGAGEGVFFEMVALA